MPCGGGEACKVQRVYLHTKIRIYADNYSSILIICILYAIKYADMEDVYAKI
jgi:hypothetical protein